MVICLERGANDLHIVQLILLPLRHLIASLKSRMVYLSDASLTQIVMERRLLNRCLSV